MGDIDKELTKIQVAELELAKEATMIIIRDCTDVDQQRVRDLFDTLIKELNNALLL